MNPAPEAAAQGSSIAAVERDTGLSKDTLRVWERRYNFPQPGRDAHGERLYPPEQISRLRLVKRLLDAGHRVGRVIGLAHAQLLALSNQDSAPLPGHMSAQVQHCFDLVKSHDAPALRHSLSAAAQVLGLAGFVNMLVAPLNALIGDAWIQGRLEIFEEHFYTESVTMVLRNGISGLGQAGAGAPRVLLTTFPQESHGLGLLMAEAFFALEGCHCLSLGVQMPIPEIASAARAHRGQIVALSFSASLHAKDVTQGLTDLRRLLPADTEIWAGGGCPVLQRHTLPGVRVLDGFPAIQSQLQLWRQTQN